MALDPSELERLPRNELIQRARRLGVERAELMTRVELRDEIVRLSETDVVRRKRVRGWLGVARDLLASVVDKGLNLPEAAALIRGDLNLDITGKPHRPVATVTLAEIYAAQGHVTRAVELLDEVLAREPDHEAARELGDRLKLELERRAAAAPLRVVPREPAAAPQPEAERQTEAELASEPELLAAPEPVQEQAPGVFESSSGSLPEIDGGWEPELQPPLESAVAEPPTPAGEGGGHDLLVAMSRGPSGTFVYWELRPESIERARRRSPEGRATVRVVALEPSWDGAKPSEREIDAEPPIGSAMLEGFAENAVVRAVLGWRTAAGFHALEVGIVVASTGSAALGDQSLEVQWAPPGRADRTRPFSLARDRLLERLHAR